MNSSAIMTAASINQAVNTANTEIILTHNNTNGRPSQSDFDSYADRECALTIEHLEKTKNRIIQRLDNDCKAPYNCTHLQGYVSHLPENMSPLTSSSFGKILGLDAHLEHLQVEDLEARLLSDDIHCNPPPPCVLPAGHME
uniref:Uncharacterized protein n=1 Tax=Glossina austeni TaxID=7395 RepID=A0A1A9V6F9_GLOAU